MQKILEAIHTAMRDDTVATVGLRTLLGHTTAPFGVFHKEFPEDVSFKEDKSIVIWGVLSPDAEDDSDETIDMEQVVIEVTAWATNNTKKEQVLRRVKRVLKNARLVTLPTEEQEMHQIKYEGGGPDLFDDDKRINGRTDSYRIYYRDDFDS